MFTTPNNKLIILLFCLSQCIACTGDSYRKKATNVKELTSVPDISIENTETDKQVAEVKREPSKIEKEEEFSVSGKNKEVTILTETKVETEKEPQKKLKKKRVKKEKPKIKFETSEYDFGEIIEGDTISYKFEFVNDGKVPLEIISADATCGCTRPSFPFIPIEPGDKGYIGVQYISINKDGDQKPEITVKSNGTPAITTLFLKGFVKQKPKKDEEIQAVKLDTLVPIKSSKKGN